MMSKTPSVLTFVGRETPASVAAWSNATFGESGTDFSCASRANVEMAELVHAVATGQPVHEIASEIADVLIVLYRLCQRCGLSAEDLVHETRRLGEISADRAIMMANTYMTELIGHTYPRPDYPGYYDDDVIFCISRILMNLIGAALALDIDVADAVDKKMAINRARKWIVSNGHGQHV